HHDALAIAQLGGVSILALKLTKSAGILGTMAIARIAEAAGMSCYVGCMIETSLASAARPQRALAAAQRHVVDRAHRRGGRDELLRGLHDRDLARDRGLPAGSAGGGAGDVGLRAVR